MIAKLFLSFYFILSFVILIAVSMCLSRILKLDKSKPFYFYITFYVFNTLFLNYLINFNPIITLFLNVIFLVLSHYIGSKFRLLGLTGQICSGKSTVANHLIAKYNAVVIDIDELNREVLLMPDVKTSIKRIFGDEIFNEKDELDKLKLRKIIFSDPIKRRQLESITHGKVFKLFLIKILKEKILNNNPLVFVENALLLRFRIFIYMCYPILAICTSKKEDIITRVMQRDTCERETAEKILNSQLSLEEFEKQSDFVIYNDMDRNMLLDEVDKFIAQITN